MTGRRRIVTGYRNDGASVVASDEVVEARTSPGVPGMEMTYLWGSDAPQTYPDAPAEPRWDGHFPGIGGVRFVTYSLPPAGHPVPQEARTEQAQAHALATFPGLLDTYEDDGSGMHTSDTTDVAIVLTGEVVLGLSDGSETTLHAGDTIVQNGTAHSWENRTDERAEMLFVLLGAGRTAS